jgi:hypothetical protein
MRSAVRKERRSANLEIRSTVDFAIIFIDNEFAENLSIKPLDCGTFQI